MKRNNAWGWLLAASLPLVISACGDDDPPAKAKITFPETSARVSESDGTLKSFHPDIGTGLKIGTTTGRQVKFKIDFDKPLADKTIIAYKLTGTASSVNPGTTTDDNVNDYSLVRSGAGYTLDDDNLTVEKGIASIEVVVNVYEDLTLEASDDLYDEASDSFQETAIFTLKSVVSGPLELDLNAQPAYTLSIYEDDTYVLLQWDISGAAEGEDLNPGDVDLDLFLVFSEEVLNYSVSEGNKFESMLIPAGFQNGVYDMQYPYFQGSTEVDFYATFINFGGTLGGSTDIARTYKGHYTTANINTYSADQEGDVGHENYKGDRQVIQRITKDKLNYPVITDVTIPISGSRAGVGNVSLHRSESLRSFIARQRNVMYGNQFEGFRMQSNRYQ